MTASNEQMARLGKGKGLRKDVPTSGRMGPTTRKVVAFADETTSELTRGCVCSSGDYGDARHLLTLPPGFGLNGFGPGHVCCIVSWDSVLGS